MWIATYETRHFSSEAYGATEDEARSALTAGLKAHAAEYGATADWLEEALSAEEWECRLVEAGRCYRDREAMKIGD